MRDIPILFSAPMVRANLRDIDPKTQTRRPLYVLRKISERSTFDINHAPPFEPFPPVGHCYTLSNWAKAKAGDRIWQRETCWWFKDERDPVTGYYPPKLTAEDVEYRADGENPRRVWTPSIHMPRWACRFTATITEVRIQRLQDISEADATAEGMAPLKRDEPFHMNYLTSTADTLNYTCLSARESYATLWDFINGDGSWEANPWVVAITYERIKP